MLINRPFEVVIVTDSPSVQSAIEKICGEYPSFKTISFDDGGDALEHIKNEKSRMVFIDLNMSGMYGDDLLRSGIALKQGIQAYIITGTDHLFAADRCMDLGARSIILKDSLEEGCHKALVEAEGFFEQWHMAVRHILKDRIEKLSE